MSGTGAGQQCNNGGQGGGSGAGHGGTGGQGGLSGHSSQGNTGNTPYTCSGGPEYDDICAPRLVGSGGGTCSNGQSGGAGGAAVLFIAGELMIFDGSISMDATGGGSGAGGGSGGGIWLDGDIMEGWGHTSVRLQPSLLPLIVSLHYIVMCVWFRRLVATPEERHACGTVNTAITTRTRTVVSTQCRVPDRADASERSPTHTATRFSSTIVTSQPELPVKLQSPEHSVLPVVSSAAETETTTPSRSSVNATPVTLATTASLNAIPIR